eukprot:scaffold712_cov404-Prasinococcus_capsulatus_cf.AAC.4
MQASTPVAREETPRISTTQPSSAPHTFRQYRRPVATSISAPCADSGPRPVQEPSSPAPGPRVVGSGYPLGTCMHCCLDSCGWASDAANTAFSCRVRACAGCKCFWCRTCSGTPPGG